MSEDVNRREFLKQSGEALIGAGLASGVGELVSRIEGANEQNKATLHETTEREKQGYGEQVSQAVVDGFGDAYEEIAGPLMDDREAGKKGATAGLLAGAVVTVARGFTGRDDIIEEPNGLIDVVANKIAPFAGYGGAGIVPGVVHSEIAQNSKDRVFSKYQILLKQATEGLDELTSFESGSAGISEKAAQLARKCLLEVGMESFDPTNMESIRKSAKLFALSELKVY